MLQKSYHTKASDLILTYIENKNNCCFTAGELSAFLREQGINVNKTTIYRNLDKMTAAGKLIRHKSPVADGYTYQSTEDQNHCEEHMHFQCCKCGSIVHLSDKKTADYLNELSKNLNIEIDLKLSSLNGLCKKCRNQE
ncbi:Fe2+ or Zn2+ uptake regulation protein [Treponema rectale]|uniref:Fe2+ or Zn2+ uptake regulation protein n=1 Tax=Treponema rectale TaxID=744512 RepID=A0A840SGD5_9SPIR|nr:transcriptional repressor [Treponema rectale]MBB5219790.1 Fe2+ or Zn2+ uptake regulation protein [Treponema rectale]